jgi:hypothetical protein
VSATFHFHFISTFSHSTRNCARFSASTRVRH